MRTESDWISQTANFRLIEGSRCTNVYALGSEKIVHVVEQPDISNDNPTIKEVLTPYRFAQRPEDISLFMGSIPRVENLDLPQILEFNYDTVHSLHAWYITETRVPGVSIINNPSLMAVEDFEKIVDWCALLHDTVIGTVAEEPLQQFYDNRLCQLGNISSITLPDIYFKVVSRSLDSIRSAVLPGEKTTAIHGDLNGKNILHSDGIVGIIDFEQGTHGGDPFVDIDKLLQIEYMIYPPKILTDYDYSPNLNLSQQYALMRRYGKKTGTLYLTDIESPSKFLIQRHNLVSAENLLRAVLCRYYLNECGVEIIPVEFKAYLEKLLGEIYDRL